MTLAGKKSYIVAALGAIYAVIGLYLGQLDGNTAIQLIVTSLGLGTLRAGIAKVNK